MAITNLATLRTRSMDWLQNNDFSNEMIDEFVQFSTHMFNYGTEDVATGIKIPPLRTRDMEESDDLTQTNGVATIPDDYLQWRSVWLMSASPRQLSWVSPDDAIALYGRNAPGLSNSFSIVGSNLTSYPANSSGISLLYYSAIPELVDDADTNWVITKHPMLYLQGVRFQSAIARRDTDLMQESSVLIRATMGAIGSTDMLGTYAYAPMRPRGMTIA